MPPPKLNQSIVGGNGGAFERKRANTHAIVVVSRKVNCKNKYLRDYVKIPLPSVMLLLLQVLVTFYIAKCPNVISVHFI